jgi:hypothetical protein
MKTIGSSLLILGNLFMVSILMLPNPYQFQSVLESANIVCWIGFICLLLGLYRDTVTLQHSETHTPQEEES